jgi:hypothetical protein
VLNRRNFSCELEAMPGEPDKIRIAFAGFHFCGQPAPTIKQRGAISKLDLPLFMGRGPVRALLVAGLKTAEILDLQKLSCPPH